MTVRRTYNVSLSCHHLLQSHTLEELLLQLGLCDLNLDCLVHLLMVSSLVIGIVFDGGGEERVDEGRLAEARLSRDLLLLGRRCLNG